MKLWLLRPISGCRHWEPWYDKAFGFVVRADSAERARELVGGEAGGEVWNRFNEQVVNPWLDASKSTCDQLDADGAEEIIIRDFASA